VSNWQERQAFERALPSLWQQAFGHALPDYAVTAYDDGRYRLGPVQAMWVAWRRAQLEVIERA
jgi:hypothetical protein